MADNEFMTGYSIGQNEGRNNGGGFFGGEGLWGFLILAMIFGWGGGGFGFGGGGGGAGFQGMATRADINEGFALNNITGGIRGLEQGLCNGFHDMTVTTMQGFNGVERGFCNLSKQLSDCCCEIRYNMANQTRDVIEAGNANTRAVLDFLVQEKLSSKDARIAQLENQIALSNQTAVYRADLDATRAELLRRLGADCPTPAYLVQPPTPVNFPVNGCGTVQFGNNGYGGGCGFNGYAA